MPKAKNIDAETLRADLAEGLSKEQMAIKHHCAPSTVERYMGLAGLKAKPRKAHRANGALVNGHAGKALARTEAEQMSALLDSAWGRLPLTERLRVLLSIGSA